MAGQGSTYEEAFADFNSPIRFHIETWGAEALPDDFPLVEAFVAEATVPAQPSASFPSTLRAIGSFVRWASNL